MKQFFTDACLIHHYGFCVPPYSISVAMSPSNYKAHLNLQSVLTYKMNKMQMKLYQFSEQIISTKSSCFWTHSCDKKIRRSNQLFAHLHCTSVGKQNLLFRPSAREQCRNEIGRSFFCCMIWDIQKDASSSIRAEGTDQSREKAETTKCEQNWFLIKPSAIFIFFFPLNLPFPSTFMYNFIVSIKVCWWEQGLLMVVWKQRKR